MHTRAIIIALMFVLAACSAAMVPMSSDPHKKLDQAWELLSLSRAIPAERLIREAMQIFEERKDIKGLAEANFRYGLMLNMPAYKLYAKYWKDYDPTVKTSIQYVERALALYGAVNDSEGQQRTSLQLAASYKIDNQKAKSCTLLDQSDHYNRQTKKMFPDRQVPMLASQFKTWEEMTADLRQQFGCL